MKCDLPCTNCGTMIPESTEAQRYAHRGHGRMYCSRKCGIAYRDAHRKPRAKNPLPKAECAVCGASADLSKHRLAQWRKTGRAYCSIDCSIKYRSKISSITMTRTNLIHASDRMRRNNPMRSIETRKKVSATLKTLGHSPKERGGNGRAPTSQESVLFTLLCSLGFVMQPAIPTKQKRGSGYPSCYKPDLGHWGLKIAVEADGGSHCGRQHLDAKKDAFLNGLGWAVLRFTNQMIDHEPHTVLITIMSTISKLRVSTLTPPTE